MLSYQHSYHAGNVADVLKHLVLYHTLQYLVRKSRSFHFYDCNAGAGVYDLSSPESRKTREADSGILRLISVQEEGEPKLPTSLRSWLKALQQQRETSPSLYPGSPHWAKYLMRPEDRATLFELHPQEHRKLVQWKKSDQRFEIYHANCFQALPSLLSPKKQHALVLVDPSYERVDEYSTVPHFLRECTSRCPQAIYLIWYPIVERGADQQMLEQFASFLKQAALGELWIHTTRQGYGLRGTGLVAVNAPKSVKRVLDENIPFLSQVFSQEADSPSKSCWLK